MFIIYLYICIYNKIVNLDVIINGKLILICQAEVQVARRATIAELKEAVEEVFSQPTKDKEIKISWYGCEC